MTKNQTRRRVLQLVREGYSFRVIEQKLTKTLGLKRPGNGTKAFRVANS